jgi:hypothetical protein
MSRKNSKERIVSFDKKEIRSYSIGSLGSEGSIETIDLDDEDFNKPIKKEINRRKREVNINDKTRRNTPDIITIKKMIERFRESLINK